MEITFPFQKEFSSIFGTIRRPYARVYFLSKNNKWIESWMVVDTGADYTLLPHFMIADLQINPRLDCQSLETNGVGGSSKVYLLPKIKAQLGNWKREIPVGFLESDDVPPLLGRHLFLETFNTTFSKKFTVVFSS